MGLAKDWGLGRDPGSTGRGSCGSPYLDRGVSGPKRAKEPGPMCSGDRRGEGGVGVGLDAIFCLAGNYLNCSLFLESCAVHFGGFWAHVALDPTRTWTV